MPRSNPIARARAIGARRNVSTSKLTSSAVTLSSFLTTNGGYAWIPTPGKVFTDRSATPSTPATPSDPVGTIKEYTGVGPAAIAPADLNRPTLTTLSNKWWCDFDPTVNSKYFFIGDLASFVPTAGTLCYVVKLVPAGAHYECVNTTGNDGYYYYSADTLSYPGLLRTTRLNAQPALPTNAIATITIRSTATAWKRRVNGTQDISAAANYEAGSVWAIGGAYLFGAFTRPWKGQIWGVGIIPSGLSDTDTATFESLMLALAT